MPKKVTKFVQYCKIWTNRTHTVLDICFGLLVGGGVGVWGGFSKEKVWGEINGSLTFTKCPLVSI